MLKKKDTSPQKKKKKKKKKKMGPVSFDMAHKNSASESRNASISS
jgi:hypothetical protein